MKQRWLASHIGAASGALGVALLAAYVAILAPHPVQAATGPRAAAAQASQPLAVTVTTTTQRPAQADFSQPTSPKGQPEQPHEAKGGQGQGDLQGRPKTDRKHEDKHKHDGAHARRHGH